MKLGEALSFRNGKTSPDRSEGGVYQVHGSNGVIGYCNQSNAPAGATVIGRVGSYCGNVHFLQSDSWVTDNAIFAFPKADQDPRYWYFVLCHLKLGKLRHGSGQPLLNQEILSGVDFDPKTLSEQRRIAGVLGALDDKIESNRRIAFKCDEVASELFGQAASMNQKLDEVSEVRMGVSPPGFSYNETGEGIAFFQGVRDFSYLHPVARVYTNAPKRLAKPGDILFSVRAPVGRLNIADSTCCIGRGLAAITPNRSAICLFALRAAAAEWEKFSAEGTVFGAVNQKSLKSTLIPWPDPVAEEELEYQLSSLVALASQSERESISLSKLRDTLLPELMSGRMRVDEAGRLVSEALDEEVADV